MSVLESPKEGGQAANTVSLQLILKCKDNLSLNTRAICLPTLPSTTQELKSAIERTCNVPACVQDLSFESHPLVCRDDVILARIRGGDTIHVQYLAEGDCKEIVQIIVWMGTILAILKHESPSVTRGISESLNDLVTHGIEYELIENLAFDYFFPWLDARKYANKLHFVSNGGLEIMMELYSLLQRESWGVCLLKMKYLEYGILRVLWNLSETFPLRRAIVQLGGLEMCMCSLMRETVVKGEAIVDRQSPRGANQDWILIENIGAALGTLCNLSELPEVHMTIATRSAVLQQLICISLSPSVRTMSSLLVATLYLCLAATPETHRHISAVGTVGLLEACALQRDSKGDEEKEMDIQLLKYFSVVFFAQIALVSPHCIPKTLCKSVNHLMSEFLESTTYDQIRDCEIKHWYVWQTFMPYVKLAFVPNTTELTNDQRTMQMLSLRLVIFSLQNMLGRSKHREVLLQENLLDYIVSMPWFVPDPLKQHAKDLVLMLVGFPDVTLQPPQLLSITKASIAKSHLGLEKVVKLSAGEIATEVLPAV